MWNESSQGETDSGQAWSTCFLVQGLGQVCLNSSATWSQDKVWRLEQGWAASVSESWLTKEAQGPMSARVSRQNLKSGQEDQLQSFRSIEQNQDSKRKLNPSRVSPQLKKDPWWFPQIEFKCPICLCWPLIPSYKEEGWTEQIDLVSLMCDILTKAMRVVSCKGL